MSPLEVFFRSYINDHAISHDCKPIYMSTSTIAEMIEDIDKLRKSQCCQREWCDYYIEEMQG